MTDRRIRIWIRRMWFSRIFSTISMHVVKVFRLRIVRFQIIIAEWPRRRDSAMMLQFAEIFLSQAKQGGSIKFRVLTHVVIGMRMQVFAIFIQPSFFGVVMAVDIHNLWVPVALFTRNKSSALQNQKSFTGWSQVVGQGSSTRAGSDDDD